MKIKALAAVLCLLFLFMATGKADGQTQTNKPAEPDLPDAVTVKDETAYIRLYADGRIRSIGVVNRIETPADGTYTDYGPYAQVTNLTNGVQPEVSGDAIRWPLRAQAGGFYYEGKMEKGEPPFLFDVRYYLDGAEINAEEAAGKSGDMRVTLAARPNPLAAAYFRERYLCQIQAGLDLDACQNISAPRAGSVITGRTQNLSYTVLPGKEALFEIRFYTRDFAFGGFTMTAILFDADSLLDMDTAELQDGIGEMQDGAQELIDGTGDLKDGLKKLSRGVSSLSGGSRDAESGLKEFKSGLKEYTGGVSELYANAKDLLAGLQALKASASDMQNGFAGIKVGVDGVFDALSPAAPPELAGQMAYLKGQMDAYAAGLDGFCAGIGDIADGMQAFCGGLKELEGAGDALVPGLASILDGMGELADGLSKTASAMKKLPDEVQKLIDGQTELKDGVGEAAEEFDVLDTGKEEAPMSFASEKNRPRSVQFLWITQEIKEKEKESQDAPQEQEETGLLEKIRNLFQ